MQRRGGNIPPPPKEANRKYPIDEARDCPRGPTERRKRKKHKVKARFSVHFPRSGSVMLRLKSENLRSKLRRMPLLRALPPLAAGILLADHYVLPLWLLVGGFLVCGILALLADDRGANLAILGAILLFGMTVTELRHTPAPPTGTPGEYEIVVRERLSEREGKTASGTTIRARRNSATGEWLPAAGNLVVRCDSSTALNPGDRAVVRGKIYPFTARHGGYGRLMTRRGYVGTLYLNRSSLLLRDTLHRELSPKHLSLFLHERAVARLDRLALAPDEQALCNAMTAGDRRSLSPALRAAYSRSGTSHLLAVSGLHVGIVFLLANLLLWWLPLFRHGHILRNIAVILLIWLYAATTGFPPSVVRATLMFSVLQFALASSSEYVGMNTLAGVAFVMLLFHPDYLFDISFQLSFIAVAGIIAWGLPLCRLLRTRRKSIDMLTATLAIGFSASAATAPLISHTFGQISVVGLALNPVRHPALLRRGRELHALARDPGNSARTALLGRRRIRSPGTERTDPSCSGTSGSRPRHPAHDDPMLDRLRTFHLRNPAPMERRTEKIGIFAPGMMTPEQYRLLLTPEVRRTVEEQIGRDPAAIALDKRIPHAALVATQVKYLARARTKLPSYYEARCILPPLAFEQASSEACAARKSCSGERVLDLTCGLGVDALYLSKRFREVITLERDATLAAVAGENFRRLGATNIRVINSSAEAFLASTRDHFDWIYADPDRRSAEGRKLVRLEDCSPDIPKLLPELRRIAPNLCVKNSPLFDVGETFRLFGPCRTEVVSLHDECKEVVVYADGTGPLLTAVALGLGEFSCPPAEARATPCDKPFDPAAYRWLLIPDVALQKARLAPTYLQGRADIWSPNGYGFAAEKSEDTLGRWLEIERIEPYNPKQLKRELSGSRLTILKQDFPLTAAEIAARLGIREGGERRIAFTKLGQDYWTIRLK